MSRLPDRWSKSTVGELAASIQYGYTASARSDVDGPRFLRITDIQDGQVDWALVPSCEIEEQDLEKYRLHDGDIVFARTGATTGKSYLIKNAPPAVFASYLIRVNTTGALDPAYLAYFFQTVDYWRQIERGKRGVGQPNVNAKTLSRIKVPVAPPDQQTQIVAKIEELFSNLDDGVAALERAKANLRRYRAAVLKATVEGKLTEEWRKEHHDVEPASVLLERILAERRKKWEEDQLTKYEANGKKPSKRWREKYKEPAAPVVSELPSLPDNWVWATMDQVSFVDIGFAFKSAEFVDNGVRLLRGDNLEPGSFRWKNTRYWPYEKLAGFEHLLVQEGEIILAMDRPLISTGLKIARATATDVPCLLVQRMARFRILETAMTSFVYAALQTRNFITHLVGGQTGTQLPHISGGGISSFVVPLPPLGEQFQIADELERLGSITEDCSRNLEESLRRSSTLRQAILGYAFSGKLTFETAHADQARQAELSLGLQ